MDSIWESAYARLQQIAPIPENEWEAFRKLCSIQTVAKNAHWVRENEPVDAIAFCAKGLFRLYYATPDGGEFNKSFCSAHDFVASYGALLAGSPSHFSIQALADSLLLTVRYSDFRALYDRHPCWERLGRILVEQLYMKKELREREFLLLSAEARYLKFLERYGPLETLIPQYHVASYLGITPVALSRIRRKLT
ncbi:CRP-like cAMP-binding protein [Cohnella sp. SGD-V74]|uniref:Crp/Fnr family transcriptional regulator n=1 Tax=unclassified Cohnella TaxID=2636738 RepID=UPI000D4FECFB|nr:MULTISPECIES: Crp/Fnr family transcriptional regulator [unclassified Cohnella]PRX70969.1 CRP-like cAMP-binding protein [Cohnella sp. SGD-V74]